jgi:outer membrane protein OmpA-like peptidoglycan-associated protein
MTAVVVAPSPPSDAGGDDVRVHHLWGEDAPIWLATGFCALGALFALAVSFSVETPVAAPAAPPAAPVARAAASDFADVPMPTQADFVEALRGPMADTAKPTAAPSDSKAAPVDADSASQAAAAAAPPDVTPAAPSPPPIARDVATSANAAPPVPVPPAAVKAAAAPTCLPTVAVTFARGSSQPMIADAARAIEPLRTWLLAHPQSVFSVEGHTDSAGPESYNVMLSYERAQAVVAWLTGLGLPRDRLAARAAGASPPPYGAPVAADNRQVVLQIEGVPICAATDDATGKL